MQIISASLQFHANYLYIPRFLRVVLLQSFHEIVQYNLIWLSAFLQSLNLLFRHFLSSLNQLKNYKMETKNSTRSNGTFFENAANTNFKANTTSLFDVYRKQAEFAGEFYSSLFNSFFDQNKNIWNPVKDYADLFWNNSELKFPRLPFSNFAANGNSFNPFYSSFGNAFKQMSDQNQSMAEAFAKQFDEWTSNLNRLSEKYRQVVQKRMEVSKEMFKALTESYHKQLEFAVESNKKLSEELAAQADLLFRTNQEFWKDITADTETNEPVESSIKNGESKNFKKAVKADSVF
jgi:hypothetical protein